MTREERLRNLCLQTETSLKLEVAALRLAINEAIDGLRMAKVRSLFKTDWSTRREAEAAARKIEALTGYKAKVRKAAR